MTPTGDVRLYTLLSVVAGTMVLLVACAGPDDAPDVSSRDRWLVGTALVAVALAGASMALRPNWRRRVIERHAVGDGPAAEDRPGLPGPPRRGHHPVCEPFVRHTLPWRGRRVCAGCAGLALGTGLVPVLVLVHAIAGPELSGSTATGMVIAGLALVAVDLFAAAVGPSEPLATFTLNALMVLGFALVSIGLLEATGSAVWGLAGVVLSMLWMDARVRFSRWNHLVTCLACPEGCVAYGP